MSAEPGFFFEGHPGACIMLSKSLVLSPRQCEVILNLGTRRSGGGFDQLAMSGLFAIGMVEVASEDRRVVLTVRGQSAYRELSRQDQHGTYDASASHVNTLAADDEMPTYRVIGVRDDGTRIVLDEALSRERAAALHNALIRGRVFPDVHVERHHRH